MRQIMFMLVHSHIKFLSVSRSMAGFPSMHEAEISRQQTSENPRQDLKILSIMHYPGFPN
jgi:hypothetical protein